MPDVVTSDGVRLAYQDAGSGRPLVIIPGITQSTQALVHQIEGLSDRYRVICYDQRGHGESGKPTHGYRLARLAKDLEDLLQALDLHDIALMGWSLGCSVAWSYYDLFGPGRLDRLILVDGSVCLCRTPDMTDQEIADIGAVWEAQDAVGVVGALRDDQEKWLRPFADIFTTQEHADTEWIVTEGLKLPTAAAATLMFDYVFSDWRDVIPRISVPTLIVGATRSHIPLSVHEWLHRTIPDSKLAVIEDRAHLMFYEEPEVFNALLTDFLG